MGKFIVRNGELEGRKFRLEPGAKIVLGRELGDLNFPDKRMSRRHCALESRDDGDYIEDMGSTNGCWVNNERVSEAKLTPGDLLRVGFTELEFLGMPAPAFPPGALAGLVPSSGPVANPNQTIAFRRLPGLMDAPPEAPPDSDAAAVAEKFEGDAVSPGGTAVVGGGGAAQPPRMRDKSRMKAAKYAAMGKQLHGEKRLVSAKGKFCEACGEAIFMKEGAADEGVVTNGLYLCRMCALIAEKQKDLGADYLPSYAKIVGGRMPEKMPDELAQAIGATDAPPEPAAPEPDVQIVESEEISLEDLTGEAPSTKSAFTPEPPTDKSSDTTAAPPVKMPGTEDADEPSDGPASPEPEEHEGPTPVRPHIDKTETIEPPAPSKPEPQADRPATADDQKRDAKKVDPTASIPMVPDEMVAGLDEAVDVAPKSDSKADDAAAPKTVAGKVDPTAAIPVLPDDKVPGLAKAVDITPNPESSSEPPPKTEAEAEPSADIAALQSASDTEIEAAVVAAVEAAMAASQAGGEGTDGDDGDEDDEPPEQIDPRDILSDMPDDNEDMPTPPRGSPAVGTPLTEKPAEPEPDKSVGTPQKESGESSDDSPPEKPKD